MATNRSGPMRGAVRETKLQQSNWRADDLQRSSQRLLFAAAFLHMSSGAKTEKCQSWPPSLSLIEAASCGSLFSNGPFGPFEILSGPSAFGQFFDCRRQNSEPIKIPNPFLFVRISSLVTAAKPGAGNPVACSTTKEAIAGTL